MGLILSPLTICSLCQIRDTLGEIGTLVNKCQLGGLDRIRCAALDA